MEINDLRRVACAPDRPEQDRRRFLTTAPFAADLICQMSMNNRSAERFHLATIPYVIGTASSIIFPGGANSRETQISSAENQVRVSRELAPPRNGGITLDYCICRFFAVFDGIPNAPEGHSIIARHFQCREHVVLYCRRAEGTVDSFLGTISLGEFQPSLRDFWI